MDTSIVILPEDKERITVVMDKADYIQKAKELLQNTNNYRRIDADYTTKLKNKINTTLKRLEEQKRSLHQH
ncbi:unnamed protein product [Echinostoma caproni]|uniref:Histidine kinase n=1 Tax=Echinostoma caproni TaxID=27848 RepID=A0A182ZZL5_9TREM|nr:unnamed protein product [Echinostoma caproni]